MALKVVTMAELRLEVPFEAERTGMTVAEVCRRYGTPRSGVPFENRLAVQPAVGHDRLSPSEILFASSPNDHGMTGSSSTIDHMNQIEDRNPMSNRHRQQVTTADDSDSPVSRLASKPHQHHTHVQQVADALVTASGVGVSRIEDLRG